MARFMQRNKVKRVINGKLYNVNTKEMKDFSFVPSIPNRPKDILAYARKKMELSAHLRVVRAEYMEEEELYITLTYLFMQRARLLKSGESRNGYVTYTVKWPAITVTALDLETMEEKTSTIHCERKPKDLLTYARKECETENISVIMAEYDPDKDLEGVYVLPVEDFYTISLPAKDGKLTDSQIQELISKYGISEDEDSDDTDKAE